MIAVPFFAKLTHKHIAHGKKNLGTGDSFFLLSDDQILKKESGDSDIYPENIRTGRAACTAGSGSIIGLE